MDFKLNCYDPCMPNKDIEGSQCTVAWYVNDLKISRKSMEVVERVVKEIEESFGEMSVNKGKEHVFVGMNVHLNNDGSVEISMKDYLIECIKSFGESFNGGANTPAKSTLFKISEETEELDKERKEVSHHIVAKSLFVAKMERPDIDLTIGCS